MIKVSVSPAELVQGYATDLDVVFTNTAPEACRNIVFRLFLPPEIKLLTGDDRIQLLSIGPGESIPHRIKVRAVAVGRWRLDTLNFSFRDPRDDPIRVTSAPMDVTVRPAPPGGVPGESLVRPDQKEPPSGERIAFRGDGIVPGSSLGGIFLSYRREDTGPYARSLQLQLGQRIPGTPIFMDLDSIEPGLDFAEVIRDALNSCAVLVALIGRQWATLTDEEGVRRLDNPDDYVRFEVKTALERGVRVIPVLVDGARPLRQQQLPAELHKLARLNAHKLSYDRYQDDANRLLDLIRRALDSAGQRPEPPETVR